LLIRSARHQPCRATQARRPAGVPASQPAEVCAPDGAV